MKIKNVILGIAAVLFAIGSAFASRLIVAPDYISVLYSGASVFKCTLIAPTCNSQTAMLCKVNVVLQNGTLRQGQVCDDNTCTWRLTDSRPIIGTVSMPSVIAVK